MIHAGLHHSEGGIQRAPDQKYCVRLLVVANILQIKNIESASMLLQTYSIKTYSIKKILSPPPCIENIESAFLLMKKIAQVFNKEADSIFSMESFKTWSRERLSRPPSGAIREPSKQARGTAAC